MECQSTSKVHSRDVRQGASKIHNGAMLSRGTTSNVHGSVAPDGQPGERAPKPRQRESFSPNAAILPQRWGSDMDQLVPVREVLLTGLSRTTGFGCSKSHVCSLFQSPFSCRRREIPRTTMRGADISRAVRGRERERGNLAECVSWRVQTHRWVSSVMPAMSSASD